jgi:hypothetical protein
MTKQELDFVLENVAKSKEELQIELDWLYDLLLELEQQQESGEITQSDFEQAYTNHAHETFIIKTILKTK